MKTSQMSLGQMLKEKGIITEEQLGSALEHQRKLSIRLGEALTEMGFVNPEDIIGSLAEQFDFQVVNPMTISIPKDVINSVPKDIAKNTTLSLLQNKTDYLSLP